MSGSPEPTVLGRDSGLQQILRGLGDGWSGAGCSFALSGPAGAGKTRLVHDVVDAARSAGMVVFAGRAVPDAPAAMLRPMMEALLAAGTGPDEAVVAALGGYGRVLQTLFPELSDGVPPEPAFSVQLAEALLRYLEHLDAPRGILLVQEDMQWADPDSVQLLEYLIDHTARLPGLLLVTSRDESSSAWGVRSRALQSRGALTGEVLAPLDDAALAALTAQALRTEAAPAGLVDWLAGWTEGNPGLATALIGTARAAGDLRQTADGWQFDLPDRMRHDLVPADVLDGIRRRTEGLSSGQLRVLAAAAALGRRFDARLLSAASGEPVDEVDRTLRELVVRGLLDTDDAETSTHRFVDPISCAAVVADQVGNRRADIVRAALDALRAARPGLPGPWCGYAADLAVSAEDPDTACELLTEAGRRALRSGPVPDAVSTFRRARTRAATAAGRVGVDRFLVEALVAAGHPEEALATGTAVSGGSARDRFEIDLVLVRAAVELGRVDTAQEHAEAAARVGTGSAIERAQLALAAAAVAIGRDERDEAGRSAREALDLLTGLDGDDPRTAELSAEAHEFLGRSLCSADPRAAEAEYARALRIADDNGLRVAQAGVEAALGTLEAFETLRTDRLQDAARLARAVGADLVAARCDLAIAVTSTVRMDLEPGLALAVRSEEVARERNAVGFVARAVAVQAVNHALAGRSEDMEHAINSALEVGDADRLIEPFLRGQARAEYALGRDDRVHALADLDVASKSLPSTGIGPWPMRGLWVLLHTLDERDGTAARAEVAESGWGRYPMVRAHLRYAEAIAAGRAGKAEEAMSLFADGERDFDTLEGADWLRHRAWRLVAEGAIADDWGDPAGWLRTALQTFVASGHTELAASCRTLLRRLGVPVPRQRSAGTNPMSQFGITPREYEVLYLMSEDVSGSDIGRRLGISTRTVEKHIERLKSKTSTRTKRELIDWLAAHS